MDAISVSAFLDILNETLGFAYPEVTVEGEVSGYKVNQGKWAFFDIKDEEGTLPCFLPVYLQKVPLEDGMTVRVTGTPKLLKWGRFSFTVKSFELAGEGELQRAFQLLRAQLSREGLFDVKRKRLLPTFPKRIGLVTSVTSAAYEDFVKILGQRWGGLEIFAADTVVQGKTAPDSIVAALGQLNQLSQPVDVIAVIRGGGSLEDLAAFSTEPVVRAIAASRTPVISGVGHEIDTSLADLAADVRATTPTNAAQLIVPDRREVSAKIEHLSSSTQLRWERQLVNLVNRIERAQANLIRFIDTPRAIVDQSEMQILQHYQARVAAISNQVGSLTRLLAGLDPTATLKRGYAIVKREGRVLRDAAQAAGGDALVIQLAKGKLGVHVDER